MIVGGGKHSELSCQAPSSRVITPEAASGYFFFCFVFPKKDE